MQAERTAAEPIRYRNHKEGQAILDAINRKLRDEGKLRPVQIVSNRDLPEEQR